MNENESHLTGFSRQDSLLTQLCQAKMPVCMYLHSGVKLQGVIVKFDACVIILRNANKEQMVFKHTILTIVPSPE